MTALFAIFLALHGLIHLLGFVKAFGLAELRQLTQPIGPAVGLLWLSAAALFLGAAISMFAWRWWWAPGACAIALSTAAIANSWSDARIGALANLVALVGVLFGFLAQGPFSLRAEYERDVDRGLAVRPGDHRVTDEDLAHLPAPVRRYLHQCGCVGRPRVANYRVRMHGRIRSGPQAAWMPFAAEQHNFVDEPARLFYLTAAMYRLPVQGYHRYVGRSATMRVKLAALVPVLDVAGREMLEGETVTLFNDMCLMAPATLIDPGIRWETGDDRTARAAFTNAGVTIQAELTFNRAGELTNFQSDDRYQASPDGGTMRRLRWSTPVWEYRSFDAGRLIGRGEARWQDPAGDYAYVELTVDSVVYNVRAR